MIYDYDAIFKFEDNDIVIPIVVIQELDKIKVEPSERGYNARKITRHLDELREKQGSLIHWQQVNEQGGRLCIRLPVQKLDTRASFDDQILAIALEQQEYKKDYKAIVLVTLDTNLRVKADAYNLGAESYTNPEIKDTNLNNTLHIDLKEVEFDITDIGSKDGIDCPVALLKNQCVILHKQDGNTILAREKKGKLKIIKNREVYGIKSRNVYQKFALEMLFDPDVKLVTLQGIAGGGKTILSSVSGLNQTISGQYNKLLVSKPVIPVGKQDLGFLPGPQPLDAKILTPTGWTTMGDLKVGDEVISRNGKATKVLGIYPKGIKEVYKITTTDETSTECCEDHLWYTQTLYERQKEIGSIKSTKQIIDTLITKRRKKNALNHIIPRNEAIEYIQQEDLPILPYTLGVLLGDGSLGKRHVSFASKDNEIINRVNAELYILGSRVADHNTKNYSYSIINATLVSFRGRIPQRIKITNITDNKFKIFNNLNDASEQLKLNAYLIKYRCYKKIIKDNYKYEFIKPERRWDDNIKEQLEKLNLLGHKAWDKFIPDIYKYSSIENRLNLLRGLMDTDGTVNKNGQSSFTTTSKQLALDLIEIVKSLGGRALLRSRNRIGQKSKFNNITTRRITYEFSISLPEKYNPFFLSRKSLRFKCKSINSVIIKSIEPVGKKEVQCILVDNPEHLYITDNFIVTHNTLEEKMAPWIKPIVDNLEIIFMSKLVAGIKTIEDLKKAGLFDIEALAYIRGRSIINTFIICDEIQNISPSETRTLLTRMGENTKAIFLGDISQIDNPYLNKYNNGLTHVINKLKNEDCVAHITLEKGERSHLANLAAERL